MIKRSLLGIALLTTIMALGLLLAACGGGGGSSIGGGGGGVGKSPISGANVYARLADGSWTGVIGTTDTSGAISFTGLGNISSSDYPVVLKATGGTLNGGAGAAFTGELRGVMTSATDTVYLTPASTMVASLVDAGKSVADAKAQVRAIVQNQLGYTGVDPLGNFLASGAAKDQNEVVQQALLFCLGVTDAETATDTMDSLLATLSSAANDLATGSSFSDVAQANSGFNPATESLADFIDDNSATINQIAADALGTSTAAMSIPAVDTTTEFADLFVVNVQSGPIATDTQAVTLAQDTSSYFVIGNQAGGTYTITIGLTTSATNGIWTNGTTNNDSRYILTTAPSVGTLTDGDGSAAVAQGDQFHAAADGATGIAAAPAFRYVIPGGGAVTPQTVTFTVTADGPQTGGVTVTRTITINIIDESSTVASSSMTWTGTTAGNLEQLTDPTGTGTTMDAGATGTVEATDYAARVVIPGGHSATDVNNKYRVSFQAPDGFKFVVGGNNWSNYDQATLVDAGSGNFDANVPNTVTLVTTADKKFGPYAFTASLIDKDDSSEERKVSDQIYFVRSGDSAWPAKIDTVRYTNSGGTVSATQLAVNGSGEIAFSNPTTFTGRVWTWAALATGTHAAPGAMAGDWYLIAGPAPSSGTYGFGDTSGGTMVATYNASSVTTEGTAGYAGGTGTITMGGATISTFFTPNKGAGKSNQDSISLKYIFKDGTTEVPITSNGSVTITSTD